MQLLQLPHLSEQDKRSYPRGTFLCPMQRGDMGYGSSPSARLSSFLSPGIVLACNTLQQEFYPEPLLPLSCSFSLEEANEFTLQSFGLRVSVLNSHGINVISQE